MELVIKHFRELTTEELFAIYQLRVSVFVVEQTCPYQEVDAADLVAYHVYLQDEAGIAAYLRVLPKGATCDEVSIGRVISVRRRRGLGTQLLKIGIDLAREKFAAQRIDIGAQTYARRFYENAGFRQTGAEYLEDGIPHIPMTYLFAD